MSVLPKKRGAPQQGSRGSSAVLHDLSGKTGKSGKNRVLSERVVSGQRRKPSGARHVSRGDMFVSNDDNDANTSFAEDAIHFHENRSTIMSNFEEWIKLSTDNKITSKNSWHFALIDYFHDLNVIKDGDNINFQRASATLDGCVKIYSSRVESAASETGKLLSGLATKRGQQELEQAVSDEEGETAANGDGSEQTAGRKERRINRVVESTLVPFEAIQIKKLDQELAIDPLFKKALAEFDEGGAKSLLLNTLNIDASGRVVFDATTNPMSAGDERGETHGNENQNDFNSDLGPDSHAADAMEVDTNEAIDLSKLRQLLYTEPGDLDACVISPSMPQLKTVLSDVNKARSILTDVNSKFHADSEEERRMQEQEQEQEQQQEPFPYPDQMDGDGDGDMDLMGAGMDFDDNDSPEDGDRLARYEEELQKNRSFGGGAVLDSPTANASFVQKETVLDSDLMAYFDERMKTNWRGPEHWRVARLKGSSGFGQGTTLAAATAAGQEDGAAPGAAAVPKRAKKEQVLIDFFAEDDDDAIEDMFRKAKSQFHISKRPEERTSVHRHVLPDDIQFNSRKLVTLFLRPNKNIVTFSRRATPTASTIGEDGAQQNAYTDEQYFADKYEEREQDMAEEERQEKLALSFHQAEMEDCENENYGLNFNDILDGPDGPLSEDLGENKDDFGSQVLAGGRKARPEYVNYSRVAKRVDIKLLKDNIWKSIKVEDAAGEVAEAVERVENAPKEKSFKEVVDVIGTMYRTDEKKDLSTSFCFICLLHLANEHGLSIEANDVNDNLMITGF